MSPEAQRIAIAEACGLKVIKTPFVPAHINLEGCMFTDEARNEWRKAYPNSAVFGLPDYLSDLNAMDKVEKSLTDVQFYNYQGYLKIVCKNSYVSATAAERAEAFLRTLGLWTESE